MLCPWCSNTNFLPRSLCAHCNEDLFPKPVTDEQAARHKRPPDDDEHAGVVAARWKSFAVSLCTVAVAAFGGVTSYVHWPVKPAPPPAVQDTAPPPDPAGQLATMNAFLETVESTRSELPAFLGSCAYAASDADTLAQIVQERDQAVNQATTLRTDDILDGDKLRQALVTMTQAMLTADKKYLTWAQRAASSGSCSEAGGSSFDQANQAAADAKRAFVKLWKGDADKYGQPPYKWNDF